MTDRASALPVLYFQQDGAYFAFRDRPFYSVDFEAPGYERVTPGVCPAFTVMAPMRVRDFDLAEAEQAAAWFEAEAAAAGYRAERDNDDERAELSEHPDCERADLVRSRLSDCDSFTSVSEFAAIRAKGDGEILATLPAEPIAAMLTRMYFERNGADF